MHLQFAFLQPLPDGNQQLLGLSFASAMRHGIIGVTGKWIIRVFPVHPFIEGIRHEQVHQHGSDH